MKKPFSRAERGRSRVRNTEEGRKFGRDRQKQQGKGRPVRTARPQAAQQEAEKTVSEELLVGRHPVLEALRAGRPMNKVMVAEGASGGPITEIIGKARAEGIVVQFVPKVTLARLAGEAHQGVAAYIAPQNYVALEEIVERETGHAPLVVLLDEVSDPHNLGAVLRTADATGVQGVVIPKRRSVPLTGVVAKASAGAIEYVPVARVTNLVQAIDRLKELGYWIVGTAVEGASQYTGVDYTGKTAVVIGSEGQGLSRLVQEKCDFLVTLPMLGNVQSLNASVAAGVLLYEVVRQRS